jgi:hypothetical protein
MIAMWPFTSRRIMGNRWWAIAFVIFVCYQAVDFIGAAPSTNNTDNATTTDISGAPVDDDQLRNAEEALKSL